MDRNRRIAWAVVGALAALAFLWITTDGFGPGEDDPTQARTAGQTVTTFGQVDVEPTDDPMPSSSDPTDEPAGPDVDPVSGLPLVALTDLPPEVAETLGVIDDGPPYPYDRDGVTFENREGILPAEEYGYYQEFTVPTPGSDDRGARRVVWGLADEFYYTGDHYASFVRIEP